jgi:hypothetical protein
MQTNRYEEISQSFLGDHPYGTIVTPNGLQTWVASHADGAVLKADLAIEDPGKRLNALKRHLNSGGQSDALPESEQFVLESEDRKRGTLLVRRFSEVAHEQIKSTLTNVVKGTMSPIKREKRTYHAIKLDELSPDEREAIQAAHENAVALETSVKPVLNAQIDHIWVTEMERRGISADQARKIRDALPVMTQFQKLLRATG